MASALLSDDPLVRLQTANSVWADASCRIKPEYNALLKKSFHAESFEVPLMTSEQAPRVNNWVKDKTQGMIPQLIDTLRGSLMVLVNTVYFKGRWAESFDPSLTRDHSFQTAEGNSVQCRMMRQSGRFDYAEGSDWQAVRLPYGSGRHAMVVFLPVLRKNESPRSGLNRLVGSLSPAHWHDWISAMKPMQGTVQMPRFKVRYGTKDMVEVFKSLGVAKAFQNDAEFSPMATAPLMISKILHQAVIDNKEEGTEASAATAISLLGAGRGVVSEREFSLVLDRPFLCVIKDSLSGTWLFAGLIKDPSAHAD